MREGGGRGGGREGERDRQRGREREREGGGREGKLGGHIKTARGHRCWIIWKVWPSPAHRPPSRAVLETDRKPCCRPPSAGLRSHVLSTLRCRCKGLMSQKGTRPRLWGSFRRFSALRLDCLTPSPFIFTSFEDTCTSTDGKRSPTHTFTHQQRVQQGSFFFFFFF